MGKIDDEEKKGSVAIPLSASDRALARLKQKQEASRQLRSKAWAGARELSKTLLASNQAPIFVPFKDRDGSVVPALILGGEEAAKQDSNGNIMLDPQTREVVVGYRFRVFAFTSLDTPHLAFWTLDDAPELPKKGG